MTAPTPGFSDEMKELEAILDDTNTPAYTDKELEMMEMFARNSESPIPMEPLILKALLRRLRAAENVIDALGQDGVRGEVSKAYDAWRRSKGDIS